MTATGREESLIGKTIFGEYTITKKLGEGGMGAVYLASQKAIGQEIAIKVLHGRSTKSDELVKRFNREAKAVSMLTHPNIIRVFIFGRTEEGLIYLAMEFVKGTSLREEIAKGPMSEMRAIKILKQTLSALAEAHDIGIIHRDLKPDNILLTTYRGEDDFVKVLDFGIAKVKDPEGEPQQKLTQAGVVYGTPEYLSPEQAQALELDHRSDIYSLGCILFEMLTGVAPYQAPTAVNILMMHVYEDTPLARSKSPDVSEAMERLLFKAMQKKPEDRFQSTNEFFQGLLEREQELIDAGEEASNIVMPGMEMTAAMVLPMEVIEQARTALFETRDDSPSVVHRGKAQPETLAVRAVGQADPRRRLLMVLIAMLTVLLGVIVAGIVVFVTKG